MVFCDKELHSLAALGVNSCVLMLILNLATKLSLSLAFKLEVLMSK